MKSERRIYVLPHDPLGKSRRRKELAYGLIAPDNTLPLWIPEIPNIQVILKLSNWLLKQEEKIKEVILDYLDNPGDDKFWSILVLLDVDHPPPKKIREGSLIDLMLRSLPASKEELYEIAIREHKSNRPESAVRTNLRRLLEDGRIKEIEREDPNNPVYQKRETNSERRRRLNKLHRHKRRKF